MRRPGPDVHTLLMEKVFRGKPRWSVPQRWWRRWGVTSATRAPRGRDNLWNGYRVRSLGVQSLKATHAHRIGGSHNGVEDIDVRSSPGGCQP